MPQTTLGIGLVLIVLAGIMEGGYSILLKYTPKWQWENTWGAGSLMALLLVPWPLAIVTVPGLFEVYKHSSLPAVISALLFGAGWGIGGVFFGLGIAAVGMSLGLSLILGIVAIGGSILPLLLKYPEQLLRPPGIVLICWNRRHDFGALGVRPRGLPQGEIAQIRRGQWPGDFRTSHIL